MITRTVLPVFCLLLLFSLTSVTAEPLDVLLGSGPYGESEKQLINEVFRKAEIEGIYADLLLPRLREAVAKKVPVDSLINALQKEIGRLVEARLHLLEIEEGSRLLLDNAAWQRTANLLAWGASGGEIRTISGSCIHRQGDYQQASHLFVSLVNWGLARDTALSLTSAVCKSRIDGDDFPGILELLIRGRRLLISPHNLSNRMIEELPGIRNLEQLGERILND